MDNKRGFVVCILGVFLLLSFTFVSAERLPFEIKSIFFEGNTFIADIQNEVFFKNSLMCSLHELPTYSVYLNGIYLSYEHPASPFYQGDCDLVLSSLVSSVRISSDSLRDFLNIGGNELVIITDDSTIDKNGTIVKREILEEIAQTDERNIGKVQSAVIKEYNSGPNVGVRVKFDLTSEQLNSQNFKIEDFYYPSSVTAMPFINAESGGSLIEGRRIFVYGSGKENSMYSIYFNDFLVSEIKTDSSGRFRNTFLINEGWVNEDFNFVILKDEIGNEIKYPLIPNEDVGGNEWSALLWLNDTEGYYGDKISIYSSGLNPDTEYAIRVRYEDVPGGKVRVLTNNLGEFEIDNYEINPPIFTDILLFIKQVFEGEPNEIPSEEEVKDSLENLQIVALSLDVSSGEGSIATGFRLCDYYNASKDIRHSGYCS